MGVPDHLGRLRDLGQFGAAWSGDAHRTGRNSQPPEVASPPPTCETWGSICRPSLLERFGGGEPALSDARWRRSVEPVRYLAYCGASTVVLPEGLADRSGGGALDGQAAEDAVGPDRLDLLLRILGRQGCSAWLELALAGPLPGLPPPDSAEALARGLVRVDRRGQADGPAYHPLHPEVRDALKRRVAEALAPGRTRPSLAGLLIRLGPGPTLLGGPTPASTTPRTPGSSARPSTPRPRGASPASSDDRPGPVRRPVASSWPGSGRMPWLTWRSRGSPRSTPSSPRPSRHASPGAVLAVATPGLDDGPAGHEARRVDLAGLAPSHAWRAVGLDLEAWPAGAGRPDRPPRRRPLDRRPGARPGHQPRARRRRWPPGPAAGAAGSAG